MGLMPNSAAIEGIFIESSVTASSSSFSGFSGKLSGTTLSRIGDSDRASRTCLLYTSPSPRD